MMPGADSTANMIKRVFQNKFLIHEEFIFKICNFMIWVKWVHQQEETPCIHGAWLVFPLLCSLCWWQDAGNAITSFMWSLQSGGAGDVKTYLWYHCQDGDNNKAQDSSHSQMSEGLVILTEELKSNQINSIWKANPEKVNIVFCLPGGVSRGIIAAISYLDLDLFCQLWPIKQFQLSLAWGREVCGISTVIRHIFIQILLEE